MKSKIKKDLSLFFASNYKNDYDELEIIYSKTKNMLSRFCDNQIIQNISQKKGEVRFRFIKDKKVSVVTTDNLSKENLIKTYNKAKENINYLNEIKDLNPLFNDENRIYCIKQHSPMEHIEKAKILKKAMDYVKSYNMLSSGVLQEKSTRLCILNSNGLDKESISSLGYFSVSITSPNKSWAQQITNDIKDINPLNVVTEAVELARINENPVTVTPGKYDVVLSPAASADLISFLAYSAFNGKSLWDNTGPFSKIGEKVLNENISITDDYNNLLFQGNSFDYEGVNKKVLNLIENGVFKNVCTDTKYAKKLNIKNTGHSLPQNNDRGAYPLNMVLSGGDSSKEKLIKSTKLGLYVNRFHYTNMINSKKTTITGMTRDGLFMIENGKITKAVKNLRFTQSIVEALNNVDGLSKNIFIADFRSPSSAIISPYMKIKGFNFTSGTDF